MSLTTPHPIWTTAGPSAYQTVMSTVQGTMISGRYRTEQLCTKWSPQNSGHCQAPSCKDDNVPEDLHHILAVCGSLQTTKDNMYLFTERILETIILIIVTKKKD